MNRSIALAVVSLHLVVANAQEREYQQGLDAFNRGDYVASIACFDQACAVSIQKNDTLNETYANALNHKASALYRLERAKEAIPVGKRALQLYKRLFGKAYPSYAEQCVNLATYCYEVGEYGQSIGYENFAIKSYTKQGVDYLSGNGRERLKIMCEQAKSDGVDLKMGFHPSVNMKEVFDTNISRQWEAATDLHYLQTCRERVDQLYEAGDSVSLGYLHAVDDLIKAYIALNDTANAEAWIQYGGPLKNSVCGEQSAEAARTYYLYAQLAFISYDMLSAVDRAQTVINILDGCRDHDDETYLNALMLRCSGYMHMGVLGTVKKDAPKFVETAEKLFGKDSRQYDNARFLYAQCLFRLDSGKSEEIVRLLRECYDWRVKHLGMNHPDTVNAMVALANFLSEGDNPINAVTQLTEAEKLYGTFYSLQTENVKNNFLGLSLDEQRNYWALFSHYYLELIPRCSLRKLAATGKTSVSSGVSYNAALFGKGILLNSEILMKEALRQFSNSSYMSLFNDIAREKRELTALLMAGGDQNGVQANRYRNSIHAKQQQLANAIHAFTNYTDRLTTDWKDVQKRLAKAEAAIEFINITNSEQEYIYYYDSDGKLMSVPSGVGTEDRYAAVIVSPHHPEPVLLSLFDKNAVGEFYVNGILREQYVSSLLWKPILDFLGNQVKRIYFSPAGVLHKMPIESLEAWDGNGLVSNRVSLHRLTSTRMLCTTEKENGKGCVLYGGLDFDAKIVARNALRKHGTQRGAIDNFLISLEGTKEEAESIRACILKSERNVSLFVGREGTEESFKALDGKKKRIIHFGTHGFFTLPDRRDLKGVRKEDAAMLSSGLYMAGANNAIAEERSSENVNEGILTSEEISHLDLHGLDMVTLSACETGLGDITGDGVFGLQRGFKKAGANSILMSLWKVDDEATCLLMTEFYKNWIAQKMTKHDALEAAKKSVRSHKEKGWDDPKYWAAFILLDGLDF